MPPEDGLTTPPPVSEQPPGPSDPSEGLPTTGSGGTDADAIKAVVREAPSADAFKGIARLPADLLSSRGLIPGTACALMGRRRTVVRLMPFSPVADAGRSDNKGSAQPVPVLLDGLGRQNAGVSAGEPVSLIPVKTRPLTRLSLTPGGRLRVPAADTLRTMLADRPLLPGDRVRVPLPGGADLDLRCTALSYGEEACEAHQTHAGLVTADTVIDLGKDENAPAGPAVYQNGAGGREGGGREGSGLTLYDDIGGLGPVLDQLREMIELPLIRPELFSGLGIEPPRGVLLSGPPGTGKTLLARAVANECRARFFTINGPEIVDRHYGASEQQLRQVFEKAQAQAPAIVFIDEIDAIAPSRADLGGERQVERRIVAQLLTLLDGLDGRGAVVVIAATNMPDMLDPALRRPGRFDREITLPIPDRRAREEILSVAVRGLSMAGDVDLPGLAKGTHGYVGADLAALVREAGMAALRRANEITGGDVPLAVTAADFETALRAIVPSQLRSVFTEMPETGWDDIGMPDAVRGQLEEGVIWPLTTPERYRRYGLTPPKGVLLHGPPGCGKTLMAKATAAAAGVNLIAVGAGQILSRWYGASEQSLGRIFERARAAAPCLLVFDEIDALVPQRSGMGEAASGPSDRLVSQFLSELDGIRDLNGVAIIATTNRPDRIDPALLRPGRIETMIAIGLPDADQRARIFAVHLAGMPIAQDVDVEELSTLTEGFSGADLAGLCRHAAIRTIRRHAAEDAGHGPSVHHPVSRDAFIAAVAHLRETRQPVPEAVPS